MNTARRALLLGSALSCLGSVAGAQSAPDAVAQNTAPEQTPLTSAEAAQSAVESFGVQEIVVTARRREESLQETPVTVTAYTGEALAERGIDDVNALATVTPGVSFDAFPRTAPRPFFRGIGSANQGAGSDPSSVAFLDGVYLGRSAMLGIDFYDLERVEVLKGPQGTLFGKNVVGGSINFITAKPNGDFEGSAELTAAEYGQFDVHLMLNVPFSERVSSRLVVGSVSNDGFRVNSRTGESLDDEHKNSLRLQTSIELGEGTDLLISGDVSDQDVADGARYNLRPRGFDDIDKPRRADPDTFGFTEATTGGLKLELNTEALGFADLTAVAAWRTLDYASVEDLDGTTAAGNAAAGVPVTGLSILADETSDEYSGEVRLTSNGDGPFSWVAGLYALRDETTRSRETETDVVDLSENRFNGDSRTDSYAVFGEGQYEFDFGLGLFAGARYTDESKSYEVVRLGGNPLAPTVVYSTRGAPGESEKQIFTYRVGANYRVTDDVFAFASVSTGFKSGAFQEQPPTAAIARLATAPETVTNYEAGLKTDLFERRVRANASVFHAVYEDFQTIQSIPDDSAGVGGSRIVVDTGNATINGLETELALAPVEFATLTARYTYLDATFDKLISTTRILANGTPVLVDFSGNTLSRTPEHAFSADLELRSPEYAWGRLGALVSVNYASELFDDNANDPIEFRDARTFWDASVSYYFDDRFTVRVFGRNLTDVEYRDHQVETAGGLFVHYAPPRQYGVTLSAAF